ncbi:MAG: hypothetical protein HT579_11000 [Candidatus Accumulibacter similis]|nr:MAG: hypothetical protein HT579_11000 [Candidatus Accumulibacter similis]
MRTRPLDGEEFQALLRAFGSHKVRYPLWDFIRIATFISVPLFLLFASVSILAENRTVQDALWRGVPVLLFGPIFLLIQRVARGHNRPSDPFARAHEDMRAGICQIREFHICRAWSLIDQGNDDNPDYLAETDGGKYVALSAHYIRQQLPLRRRLEIHELPKSRATVAITFSGEEVPLDSTVIRTDCVWRNDDLPWERPIAAKRLPEKAQKAVLSSTKSNDNTRNG